MQSLIVIVIVLGLGLVSGCATEGMDPVWYKPYASQQDFSIDRYDCLQQAQQLVATDNVGTSGGAFITNQELFDACMNAKGWYFQVRPTDENPISRPSPGSKK